MMRSGGDRGIDGVLPGSAFSGSDTPQPGTDHGAGWIVNFNGWAGSAGSRHNGSNGRWFAHTVIPPVRNVAMLVVTNSGSREAVEDVVNVMIRRFEAMPN